MREPLACTDLYYVQTDSDGLNMRDHAPRATRVGVAELSVYARRPRTLKEIEVSERLATQMAVAFIAKADKPVGWLKLVKLM